ncbi:MAG: hypothetical protein ACTHOH_01730 [Lysobacteraceae bacterium]
MNIWQWMERLQQDLAEAGQVHNAELIERLSSEICDLETERAEALLPELKALCRTLDNPWLEVFIGHWEMRNRLGNNGEGETALREAVALFEFAHRDDTVACPQSVCVTQDLSACYANIDGPGWVEERIAVCDETLARIDPTWACFQCLSNEKAEALIDAGRLDDALAYLQAQQETLLAHGQEVNDGVREIHHRVLLAMGRHAEALERIEALEAEVDGPEWRNISLPRALQKAEALAALGRDDEAWDALPGFHDTNAGNRWRWLRAILPLLQRQPARNTWALGRGLEKALRPFASTGAHRTVVDMAITCADLALARDARWSAERHLRLARTHRDALRDPASADAALAALQARIDAHPRRDPMPVPAEDLSAWLQQRPDDDRNPEQDIEWLLAAVVERPDDAGLCTHAASALQACGADRDAIDLLWRHVERRAGAEDAGNVASTLLSALLAAGDHAGVERLTRLCEAHDPRMACWCRARLAQHQQDWPAVERHCLDLLARSPDAQGARRLLAHALMTQRRFADAAVRHRELCEADPDDRSARWDHLAAATAAEDWTTVRAVAAELGMTLEPGDGDAGGGAIDEDWGWVIVRHEEDGKTLDYYARRSGPVHAVMLENAPPAHRQRVGDRVVFDAAALHPAPEDEEERRRFVPTFRAIHTLSVGGYGRSWVVDGPAPDDDAFDALREALHARGWRVWIHSGDGYRLEDGAQDGAPLPGVVFTVSAPATVAPAEIDRALAEATAGWPHRVSWVARAASRGAAPQPHRDALARYRL